MPKIILKQTTPEDATAVLKNTVGTTLLTEPIPSGASEDIIAPDATAVVKDTEGNTLATEAIASGTSEDIVVSPAGGGSEVLYAYNYGALNTGQDVSYATGDDKDIRDTVFNPEIASWDTALAWSFPVLDPNNFDKLLKGSNPDGSGNNIFGNLERFTDENGLQVYGNNYVLDHYTGLAYSNAETNKTWNNHIADALTYSLLGYSDWFVSNNKVYFNMFKYESGFASNAGLNRFPLFIGTLTWSSTTRYNDSSRAYYQGNALNLLDTGKTGSIKALYARKAFQYNETTKEMDLI